MANNTAAVQILITINGKSVTVSNNKKNVVSLKVSRVIGDAANKFTLELFDETAWKLESALYGTKNTPISIQYGATGNWNSKNIVTFTGICTNYNLSFVGAATMLTIEGVVHTTGSVDGSTNATFWFRNETICWVDCEVDLPDGFDVNKANSRAACKIDGKNRLGKGGLDRGFEDVINDEYADYICARIEWIPPEDNDGKNWAYRPLINPTNIFKRIIRKYNGDEDTGANYKQMSQDYGGEGVEAQEKWYKEVQESYGNFKIGEYDETLWVDATSFQPGMLQSNTTAADFITNVLCKIAVKPRKWNCWF